MELHHLRYLVVVAFMTLNGNGKGSERYQTATTNQEADFTIVGRKGKSSVGIDRLPCYVDCILRSQESEDAGDLLSGGRFS
jgi:hypothetical protein